MSAFRACAIVVVLVIGPAWATAAAPPPWFPVARWVEDLASEDEATWRAASDRLWKAGRVAEPALRAAQKHADPDVVLRARLILSRFEWGIYPDTPSALVRLIERYRDGDQAQRRTAIHDFIKQGRAGYAALQRLLARESDKELRQYAASYLKQQYRVTLRDLLGGGDRAGALDLLDMMARAGGEEAMRDLAALWMLTGQAAKARDLERRALVGDQGAAALGAYLYRAAGNLRAARRLAEKAGDGHLLAGLLFELQDFKALLQLNPRHLSESPAILAVLYHHAARQDECEAELKRIPDGRFGMRARALFFCGRPGQAIDADRQAGQLASACRLLAVQGRRREALNLSPDSAAPSDLYQRTYLLVEQAVLSEHLGQRERADRLLGQGLALAEKQSASSGLLSGVSRGGIRMNRRKEVLDLVGKALDRVKSTGVPQNLLITLSERDWDVMAQWWDFLRRQSPDTAPSAILARLRGWFEDGKADKGFDDMLAEAERQSVPTAEQKDRWRAALARTCVVVGKPQKAEELLRRAAETVKTAAAYVRLGDFYFERKQWREAAARYARALEKEKGNSLALYLRGLALVRLGEVKEGQALVERARLVPLADERARYDLAQGLARRGLAEEAAAERLLLVRTAPFRSIYATNAASSLAGRAARQKRYAEAARYHRQVYLSLVMGGGGFIDSAAYLMVPARAHQNEARALLAEGKLDAALRETRTVLEYLPEDIGVVIDVVRELDRGKRKADADRLFAECFARQQKACAEAPRAAEYHNRLAWLAARCGRQLDRALRHAQAAAALMPRAAGYADTLAEVHFQRGDREAALAAMRRVLKLAPGNAYFKARRARIEAGDPKAELPER
jgi:tetratricopeptide (TPR) repeat protein